MIRWLRWAYDCWKLGALGPNLRLAGLCRYYRWQDCRCVRRLRRRRAVRHDAVLELLAQRGVL